MQHNTITTRHPRSRFLVVAGVFVALMLTLAACSSSSKSSGSPASSGPAASGGAGITIKNLTFTTKAVSAGATVTIQNNDSFSHTVTSDTSGLFDVTVEGGKSATITAPATAGSYKFHCNIHSQMHGTLTVQ